MVIPNVSSFLEAEMSDASLLSNGPTSGMGGGGMVDDREGGRNQIKINGPLVNKKKK